MLERPKPGGATERSGASRYVWPNRQMWLVSREVLTAGQRAGLSVPASSQGVAKCFESFSP